MVVFYNFLSAIVICALAYVIGEWVSTATKAWVPSVFVTAVIFLVGFWTVIPKTLVKDTMMLEVAGSVAIYLLITHIGTLISLKQLAQQWKTIIVCLVGLAGMVILGYFIGGALIDKTLVIAGLPPLTGGIVAATIMQTAAMKAGLQTAAVFAIAMYCIQGFAGYPLTAFCLHKYGNTLQKEWRSGELHFTDEEKAEMASVGLNVVKDDSNEKKLIPRLPDKWNSPVLMIGKVALVAWVASLLGQVTPVNGAIWALLLGIIFTHLGFLETNILTRANSYWFLMFALTLYVFDGLKNCTPAMLKAIIGPMILLIVIGVAGMGIASFVVAKVLKMSPYLAFANGLTALYGFPFDAIITQYTCDALTDDPEERAYMMSKMFPSMITGGFITVTITSVILAGVFAGML